MKTITLSQEIAFAKLAELSEEDRLLVEKAIEATDNSYSPYSHFKVGAALRLTSGRVFIGANQENAAFGATMCAERSALFAAGAECPTEAVEALAIAAKNQQGLVAAPVSPCGTCRQVILETEQRHNKQIKLLLYGTSGVYVIQGIETLLPLCFVDASMK